jgi:hypothetical protein
LMRQRLDIFTLSLKFYQDCEGSLLQSDHRLHIAIKLPD